MTDTTDPPLDLSILAQVDKTPDVDEKPLTSGGAPRGKPADEDAPPTRRRSARHRAERPPDPKAPREFVREGADELFAEYRPGIFVKPITEAYMTGAAIIMPFNQPIATSIMQNAENCAKAWDNAAKVDKRVRKYLMQAMQTGVLLPLLIAHFPIMTVVGVVLFPGKPRETVESPVAGPGETINPVSNGFRRPQ